MNICAKGHECVKYAMVERSVRCKSLRGRWAQTTKQPSLRGRWAQTTKQPSLEGGGHRELNSITEMFRFMPVYLLSTPRIGEDKGTLNVWTAVEEEDRQECKTEREDVTESQQASVTCRN